jgi:hypothetical protein
MSLYPAEPLSPRPTPIRHVAKPERPVSLPVPLTSFVGRTRETVAISDLLRKGDTRLVTLTGPGGGSKTRGISHGEHVRSFGRGGTYVGARRREAGGREGE